MSDIAAKSVDGNTMEENKNVFEPVLSKRKRAERVEVVDDISDYNGLEHVHQWKDVEGLILPMPELMAVDKFKHQSWFSRVLLHQQLEVTDEARLRAALARIESRNQMRAVQEFTPTMRAAFHVEMLTLDPFMSKLITFMERRTAEDWCFMMMEQAARSFTQYTPYRSIMIQDFLAKRNTEFLMDAAMH